MTSPEAAPDLGLSAPRRRPGSLVGNLMLLDTLADRPGGRTYLAYDRPACKVVVVQLVAAPPAALAGYRWALQSAQKAAQVSPLTPVAGGVLGDEGLAYSVHPYVRGVELEYLLRAGSLDVEAAVGLCWAVAGCASRMHARREVHGDLHFRNVLVSAGGDIKLVGNMLPPLARGGSSRPAEAECMRTAAPEVAAGAAPSAAGDVFSLGLLLYRILVGEPLVPAATAGDAAAALEGLRLPEPPARGFFTRIPPVLDVLLQRMLSPDPRRRLADAGKVVQAIMRSWPRVAAHFELARSLDEVMPRAVARSADFRLVRAEEAVRRGRYLGAVAALYRLGGLGLGADDARVLAGQDVIRHILWAVAGGRVAEPVRDVLTEMAAISARRLGAPALCWLAAGALDPGRRRRLQGPGTSAPPAGGPELIPALRRRVVADPRDVDATLALAIFGGEAAAGRGESLHTFRARVLYEHRLWGPAVAALAATLGSSRPPPGTLALLKSWSKAAADAPEDPGPVTAADEVSLAPLRPPAVETPEPPAFLVEAMQVIMGGGGAAQADTILLAEESYQAACARAAAGEIEGAAQNFHEVLAVGHGQREHFLVRVRGELRGLLWWAFRRRVEGGLSAGALGALWELAIHAEADGLLPLSERLLLGCSPEPVTDTRLAECLDRAPDSILLRREAAARAEAARDPEGAAGHLLAKAREFLRRREITAASRLWMRARLHLPPREGAGLWEEILAAGQELARCAQAFAGLRAAASDGSAGPAEVYRRAREFLDAHPGYAPAARLIATLPPEAVAGLEVADDLCYGAVTRLLEGRVAAAREGFREVLRRRPGHQDALLYLAVLEPPEGREGTHLGALKVEVLRREGLPRAAFEQARALLVGSAEDLPLHRLLADLAPEAGEDPLPHLFAMMVHEVSRGRPHLGRQLLREAAVTTGDPELLVSIVLESPELGGLFQRAELLEIVSAKGAA